MRLSQLVADDDDDDVVGDGGRDSGDSYHHGSVHFLVKVINEN